MRKIDSVPAIKLLKRDAHKGDRGRMVLVAGSLPMSGAARLAGWGALRSGAGLVTVATPEVIQPIVASDLPCAMTLPLPSRKGVFTAAGATAVREATADAFGIGPGIGTTVAPFLRKLLKGLATPVVLDADALNVLAAHEDLLAELEGPRVLTPHPGEASRLLGREVPRDAKGRIAAAEELADRHHAIVVLKGASTIVTDADRYYVNKTGNPGMATGGSGDVLTGVLTTRLAQGADPLDAAIQAVALHGHAGDLACAAVGEHGMIATDIVGNLPAALSALIETKPKSQKRTGSRRRG